MPSLRRPSPAAAQERRESENREPRAGLPHLPGREQGRAFVTLNVRVDPAVDALVRRAMASTGESKRAVVEHALRLAYG